MFGLLFIVLALILVVTLVRALFVPLLVLFLAGWVFVHLAGPRHGNWQRPHHHQTSV
jgi:hypothetical protein